MNNYQIVFNTPHLRSLILYKFKGLCSPISTIIKKNIERTEIIFKLENTITSIVKIYIKNLYFLRYYKKIYTVDNKIIKDSHKHIFINNKYKLFKSTTYYNNSIKFINYTL